MHRSPLSARAEQRLTVEQALTVINNTFEEEDYSTIRYLLNEYEKDIVYSKQQAKIEEVLATIEFEVSKSAQVSTELYKIKTRVEEIYRNYQKQNSLTPRLPTSSESKSGESKSKEVKINPLAIAKKESSSQQEILQALSIRLREELDKEMKNKEPLFESPTLVQRVRVLLSIRKFPDALDEIEKTKEMDIVEFAELGLLFKEIQEKNLSEIEHVFLHDLIIKSQQHYNKLQELEQLKKIPHGLLPDLCALSNIQDDYDPELQHALRISQMESKAPAVEEDESEDDLLARALSMSLNQS